VFSFDLSFNVKSSNLSRFATFVGLGLDVLDLVDVEAVVDGVEIISVPIVLSGDAVLRCLLFPGEDAFDVACWFFETEDPRFGDFAPCSFDFVRDASFFGFEGDVPFLPVALVLAIFSISMSKVYLRSW